VALTLAVQIETDVILQEMMEGVTATPAKLQKAYKRAIRKMVRWLQRQVLQAASQATTIGQKWWRDNLRVYVHFGKATGGVWIGLNPIRVSRLGRVHWTRRMAGARVGRRSYPGTFAAKTRTGHLGVWQRRSASRLPIDEQYEAVYPPILARMERIEDEAQVRFERLLRQEIQYALAIEGKP